MNNFDFGKILDAVKNFFADKTKRLIAIIAAAVLVVGIFLICMFDRPNVKFSSLEIPNSKFAAQMAYGTPTGEDETGEGVFFENCIKFYGIPVKEAQCWYKGTLEGKVFLYFDAEYRDSIIEVLDKHCEEDGILYYYKDLVIKEADYYECIIISKKQG